MQRWATDRNPTRLVSSKAVAALARRALPRWRKTIGDLLTSPGELSQKARARLSSVDGLLATLLSDGRGAQAQLEGALKWLDAHDDDEGRAVALFGMGIAKAPFDAAVARGRLLNAGAGARLFRLDRGMPAR